jgi:hypothetical protein
MHPGHLLLVALVLAGVVVGGMALLWAWRTSYGGAAGDAGAPDALLREFVRRDRQDPEAARRWLRDALGPDQADRLIGRLQVPPNPQ